MSAITETPRNAGMSAGWRYTRTELIRVLRNRRFFFFTLGFPIVMFVFIAIPNRHITNFGGTGVSAPVYYMASLASFGTMMSMVSTGTRIAAERQVGWTRQLRITPLPTRAYFTGKILSAYMMSALTIICLYAAGIALGASLPLKTWLEMTGLIIVGLAPFAAFGVTVGHLLNVDAIGPVTGGSVSLLALISGTWFPVTSGFLYDIGRLFPSYWLAQAGHLAANGKAWGPFGWIVVIGWLILMVIAACWAYQRDTGRV
jgi:ABC-2 type transport system permease protein